MQMRRRTESNVNRVKPGQAKASKPKMIAAMPRNNSNHQFLANACTMAEPANLACSAYRAAESPPDWLESAT